MKSYSDDMPNVTKEELDRTKREASETNELVKANLAMMEEFEREVEAVHNKANTKLTIITVLTTATLLVSAGTMLFLAFLQTNV